MRNIIINSILVVAGIVLGAVLIEAGVALLSPQAVLVTRAPDIFFITYDEELGWINKKGASGRYEPSVDIPPTTVRINAIGFRGGPVSVEKPPGTRRILVLGDSNSFGYGVEEEQRYSDLLAGSLPKGYEVLNFGVFGYGTDQAALLFERNGLMFKPDIVVLGFSAGDVSDNMSSINGGYSKPFFRIEGNRLMLKNIPVPGPSIFRRSSSRGSSMKDFLYRHSHLYRLLFTRLTASHMYTPDSVLEMDKEEGMETTVAILNSLNELCRMNGCRLVVLLIPHGKWVKAAQTMQEGSIGYYGALRSILPRFGITVIDTTDALVKHSAENTVFLQNDPVHLTISGNEVVADILYRGLLQHGLLGGVPSSQ